MSRTFAQMAFMLQWRSGLVTHRDGLFAGKVNFWRDYLPPELAALEQQPIGSSATTTLPVGEPVPASDKSRLLRVKPRQFDRNAVRGMTIEPVAGRYFPIGFLDGVPGYFRGDRTPALCREVSDDQLLFDVNHPLAGRELQLTATLLHLQQLPGLETGGACFDWPDACTSGGPGMQARDAAAALPSGAAMQRLDSRDDGEFYQVTRMVPHIDSQASAHIAQVSSELLQPGMKVLDLMSSWQSHLPEGLALAELVGVGMNQEELAANPHLTERLCHDLNANPQLPFADQRFDAILCHLSIEYLTDPQAVLTEVARLLRPGGTLLITFSNRWFPTKAIARWSELHEFERVGLVLDQLIHNGRFDQLNSWSMRGWPRPTDDRYADQVADSDPIYAVWGSRRADH